MGEKLTYSWSVWVDLVTLLTHGELIMYSFKFFQLQRKRNRTVMLLTRKELYTQGFSSTIEKEIVPYLFLD